MSKAGKGALLLLLLVPLPCAGLTWGALTLFRPVTTSPQPRPGYEEAYRSGLIHLQSGSYHEAVVALEGAVRIDPLQPLAYLYLAQAYEKIDQPRKAIEALGAPVDRPELRRFAESIPTFHRFYALRGSLRSALGEYEKAKADLQEAIALEPRDGAHRYDLAGAHLAMGSAEEALPVGLRALELGYWTYLSTFRVGRACMILDRHREAEEYFRESIRMNPGYTEAYQLLAETLEELGETEEAGGIRELAKKLKRVDEEIASARMRIPMSPPTDQEGRRLIQEFARYCARYSKYKEVVTLLGPLVSLYPDSADDHILLARAKARLGEEEEAEGHFMKALTLRRTSTEAMNELALLVATAKKPAMRRRDPGEAYYWPKKANESGYRGKEFMAEALNAMGHTDKALLTLGQSLDAPFRGLIETRARKFREFLIEAEIEPFSGTSNQKPKGP